MYIMSLHWNIGWKMEKNVLIPLSIPSRINETRPTSSPPEGCLVNRNIIQYEREKRGKTLQHHSALSVDGSHGGCPIW